MCLAVPMRIVAMDDDGMNARCEARGVAREVSLFLLRDSGLTPGDYVMVHVGYAIARIEAEAADAAWSLLEEMSPGA